MSDPALQGAPSLAKTQLLPSEHYPKCALVASACVLTLHCAWSLAALCYLSRFATSPAPAWAVYAILGSVAFVGAGTGVIVTKSLSRWRKTTLEQYAKAQETANTLLRNQTLLEEVQAMVHVGAWEYDATQERLKWTPEVFRIHDMEPQDEPPPVQDYLQRYHPEDRDKLQACVLGALKQGIPYELECRIITAKNAVKTIHDTARPIRNSEGKITGILGIRQDITERKLSEERIQQAKTLLETRVQERTAALQQANETMQAREQLLRLVIENTPLYLYWKDHNLLYAGCNTNYARAFGLTSPADIIGKSDYDLHPTQEEAEYYRALDISAMESDTPLLHHITPLPGDKAVIHWMDLSKIPIHNAQGEAIGVLGCFEDITERVRAQEALTQSEEQLRTVVQSAPLVLFSIDQEERLVFVEGSPQRNMRTALGHFVGSSIQEVFPPDSVFVAQVRKALTGKAGNALIEQDDMRYETHFSPVWDSQGMIVGAMGVAVDVTLRARAEMRLQEQQAFLRNIIDTDPNLIYVKDKEGAFLLANKATGEFYGVDPQELVGRRESDFIASEEQGGGAYRGVEAIQEQFIPEKRVTTPQGELRWHQMIKRPLMGAHGQANNVLCIASDITARKKVEEDLVRAKVSAEAANRAKSQFIASMSHELRTPLNAVVGFAELLGESVDGTLSPKYLRFAQNILNSGRHLVRLINDILDMAKLDAQRLDLEYALFPVTSILNEAKDLLKVTAERKRIKILVTAPDNLPMLHADAARVKQMLFNLLNSAIKFAQEGDTVTVDLQTTRNSLGEEALHISAIDADAGISPNDLQRILDETEPLDASEKHKYTGFRIGLALTRRLAEAHGGRIWAEDRATSHGHLFHIEIPCKPPPSAMLATTKGAFGEERSRDQWAS